MFKLVWLLGKKNKGYHAFLLFHLLFSCRVSYVTGGCSKQERACYLKTLSHWPPLYFSFIGWRFFQPRVSARKPLWQLGYTPTILVHSAILTSSTRKRLSSTWTFFQQPTQKLTCPYCQQTVKTYDKAQSTMEFTS